MLIDLLARSNYVSYNIVVANMLGLHTAIYLNAIMDINSKAIRKNKLDGEYFTVDRNYLKSITTFDESEQKDIEKKLLTLGILEKNTSNDSAMMMNISVLTSILMNNDESLVADIKKIVKSKNSTRTKSEAEIERLRTKIVTANTELRDAYSEWIQSVYAKQGWMSVKSVTNAQEVIDEFTNRNLDLALKIIEIASINGYRDMTWAINTYKKDYNVSYNFVSKGDNSRNVGLSDKIY